MENRITYFVVNKTEFLAGTQCGPATNDGFWDLAEAIERASITPDGVVITTPSGRGKLTHAEYRDISTIVWAPELLTGKKPKDARG